MVFLTIDNNLEPNFVIENNIITRSERIINTKIQNIGQAILKSFNDEPDHIAQIEAETGKQTTFNEMRENTIRCALWIKKQGLKIDDVVTICTHNHLDAYIPFIGTLLSGMIYNPWTPEVNLRNAQHLMGITRPKLIFTCISALNVLQEAARLENLNPKIIVFESHPQLQSLRDIMELQTNKDVQAFEVLTIEDEAIATMLFSSGTTGKSKCILHTYKELLKIIINFPILPSYKSVCLWYTSFFWVSGTMFMLLSILTGATRILHAKFDPVETCNVLEKFKVNWIFLNVICINSLAKSDVLKNYELTSLEAVITGGNKLSPEILDKVTRYLPRNFIAVGYGLTEIGGPAIMQTKKCKRSDSVGFVGPNIQTKVIDINSGEVLGPNQPGEICFKSSMIMVGYYQNPDATKSTIDEEGWLHSGDKGYYDEDGEFYIIDRIKEMIKFRGYKITPTEIEAVLLGHPAVMTASVVPVPHEMDIERAMAFVKKIPGSKVTEDELVELTSSLGYYNKLWGGVKFLEEMPLTDSGKVNRKDLKEMAKMYGS